ncbi:hypothetical protein GCM10027032_17320 [Simplicispira piscis]
MAVYLLTPLSDNIVQARALVEARLGDGHGDFLALPNGRGWLISFRGTSVELSNFLGITGFPEGGAPTLTSVLITSVNSYYGRASSDVWEWLKVRFESAS